jgi:hypothetical protein
VALTDEQRIAIIALAIRDHRNGRTRPMPDMIQSPEDIERLLANMGLPFHALLAAARQADASAATPDTRRSAVAAAYADAIRAAKPGSA